MIDFKKIKTFPINERKNLRVKIDTIVPVDSDVEEIKNKDFDEAAERVITAYKNKKMIILMMGAHVIKTGMSLYIIELMKKGIIKHIAVNGACSIHDFELAFTGETSEDVEDSLERGEWGMVEETGHHLNQAIIEVAKNNQGYGHAVGKKIDELNCKYKEYSIFWNAYKLNIPVSVHVAIGTDTIHYHPECDGASLGKTTFEDFKLLTDSVSKLEDGAAINIGSAVILPEVFSKTLNIARNLGFNVKNITTINFDFINQYRPKVNIVERPTMHSGKGFNIIEKHQITIPNLYKKITGEK